MIDIIILTKDHIEDTKKCIESIETKHPYELIVVDSGSKDGTQDYCDLKGALVVPTEGPFCFGKPCILIISHKRIFPNDSI